MKLSGSHECACSALGVCSTQGGIWDELRILFVSDGRLSRRPDSGKGSKSTFSLLHTSYQRFLDTSDKRNLLCDWFENMKLQQQEGRFVDPVDPRIFTLRSFTMSI